MFRKTILVLAVSFMFAITAFAQGSSSSGASSTSDAPKRTAVFRPTKDQIRQVQSILKTKNLYSGEASGKYNDETRAGIKMFQKSSGLRETGTLNRATLEKFGVELTESQKAIPVSENSFATTGSESKTEKPKATASGSKKTIFRATKDQITDAQNILKTGSFYSGDATGKLNKATRDGLKKYQAANGLKETGTLNAATLEKMGIELTDTQKAAQ